MVYSIPPSLCLKIFYNNRLTSKTNISKLGLIILITSISVLAVIQVTVYAQLQQRQQLQPPIISVKITLPTTGQQVPAGQLTISGISTDNATTDCTVYTDWNNTKPFQKALATGTGGVNDYSTWTFTYTDNYHLITNGTNNLTSKLSCVNSNNVATANITKSYSVDVIGTVDSSQALASSSATPAEGAQNNLSIGSVSSPSLSPVNGANNSTKTATTTTTTSPESVPSVPITPSPAPSSSPSIQEQEEEDDVDEEEEVPQTEPEPQTEPQPDDNGDTTIYWDIQ
jgi:hypothetical protein